MPFEIVPHTADLAMKVWGQDLKKLAESVVQGYVFLLTNPRKIGSSHSKEFKIAFSSPENLLVRLLNKIIYLFDVEGFVSKKAEISISQDSVSCKVLGEDYDKDKHVIRHCIKAATYGELEVVSENDSLTATIILDD